MVEQEDSNTILLIADISGYTRFTKEHAHTVAGSHGKQIIVRLLKALMKSAKPPLRVAELEGDAVFFYARASNNSITEVADRVKEQLVDLFSAFKAELQAIDALTTCGCDACDHIHDLQLKEVIHLGRADIEQVGRFQQLFGLDVIIIHRLLKNSIPAKEYVLMTKPMLNAIEDFFGLQPEHRQETFEGVGTIETVVFYPDQLPLERSEDGTHARRVSISHSLDKFVWQILLRYHTVLDRFGLEMRARARDGVKA